MGYTPICLVTEVFCVDCCGVKAKEKQVFFFHLVFSAQGLTSLNSNHTLRTVPGTLLLYRPLLTPGGLSYECTHYTYKEKRLRSSVGWPRT